MNKYILRRNQLHFLSASRAVLIFFMSFVFLESLSMEDMEKLALHYLVVVFESVEADRALLDYISNRLALADL